MQTNVTLQPMMSFMKQPLFISFLIGLFFLAVFLLLQFCKRRKTKKVSTKAEKPVVVRNMDAAKPRYIGKLNALSEKYKKGGCTTREAYLSMSNLIRSFVQEATGINVLNMSLSDVKALSMPSLEVLMEEYYSPEFSSDANGDVLQSIAKTIQAIAAWK